MDSKESEARRLAEGPLGEHLAKYPLLFAKAMFFGGGPSRDRSRIRNGTVTLADLGTGPLAITCAHVISTYRRMRKYTDRLVFQIGDMALDPLIQLIDEDPISDIATIRLTSEQAKDVVRGSELGSCIHLPISWPPAPLRVGDFVAFGGFPGKLRTRRSADHLIFDSWSSGASEVSSVSETRFVSAFDRTQWVHSFGDPRYLHFSALGGISGGPAFVDRGLYREFVGIVSDYSANYDAVNFAVSSRINRDGTIRRAPV